MYLEDETAQSEGISYTNEVLIIIYPINPYMKLNYII